MAANAQRGEVEVDLGERKLVLRPTFTAIAEIEVATGKGISELVSRLGQHTARVTDLVTIIYHAARAAKGAGNPDLTEEEVGRLVVRTGAARVALPVLNLLLAVVLGEEATRKNADAPAPAAAGVGAVVGETITGGSGGRPG